MANSKGRTTSKRAATAASKVLRDGRSGQNPKTAARSALSQRPSSGTEVAVTLGGEARHGRVAGGEAVGIAVRPPRVEGLLQRKVDWLVDGERGHHVE